jgi:hypothetical protein
MALRELVRAGARYNWTNRRIHPTQCVLDRVLVLPTWEAAFPFAHSRRSPGWVPIIPMMCIGEGTPIHQSRFFFQTWWFGVPGFGDLLGEKLRCYISDCGPHRCSVELCQCVSRNSRQFLKGRGANLGREKRNFRANLLRQVEDLDRVADANGLDEEGWALHSSRGPACGAGPGRGGVLAAEE